MKQSVSSGVVYLMVSEGAFIVSNYLLHIGIAKYLGVEAYGVFGVLMSLYLLNRSFLNTGFPRAVSKFIAEEQSAALIRTSLIFQLTVAVLFALGYVLFAPLIAAWLQDDSLINYIRFLGIMIIPLALMGLYLSGYLNGLHKFREQAFVKFLFPLLRLVLAGLLVWLGMEIFGVLLGMFIASIICLLFCFPLVRLSRTQEPDQSDSKIESETKILSRLVAFSVPVTMGALALTLLRNINVLMVKSLLADNLQTGLFTAALTLSNIPYAIFTAFPLALLPALSSAYSSGNLEKTKRYIAESLRYLLLLLLPVTAMVAATAPQLLHIFYSSAYTKVASVLIMLTISATFLTLFVLLSSVLIGIGKPSLAMGITLFSVLVMFLLNYYLVPSSGLKGAAFSSLIAAFLALCLAGGYVYRQFKVLIHWRSTLNIVVASLVIFLLAQRGGFSDWLVLAAYMICGVVYLAVLGILGEIRQTDVEKFKKIFKFAS